MIDHKLTIEITDISKLDVDSRYQQLSPFFYLHAIYNLVWGTVMGLVPSWYFDLVGMTQPLYLPFWQTIGMFVLVYAPAYYWIARDPKENYRLVLIAGLGTLLGPLGFVFSLLTGTLPLQFGWTIITNDLIWFPLFARYLYLFFNEEDWKAKLTG